MTFQYNYAVFIGRFQPVHSGHHIVIQRALQEAEKLIIVIGSHNRSRTLINPFTTNERKLLIESLLTEEEKKRVIFTAVEDHGYADNAWLSDVQRAIESVTLGHWRAEPTKIALIGHQKDGTSYYLKMFPELATINVETTNGLSATGLRELMYNRNTDFLNSNYIVNQNHRDVLWAAYQSDGFQRMVDEFKWLEDTYFPEWGRNVKALTTDAVVTMGGHILLIQRGDFPGKGLWALPGGFLNNDEFMLDGMIRELREETGLKIPAPVLRGAIAGEMIADDPWRDPRGRIVTRAFHVDIKYYGGASGSDIRLPDVKGMDDAKHAEWVPLGTFASMRSQVFADHYDIVDKLIGGF